MSSATSYPRLALNILRAADGPLPIRVIAVQALALKEINLPDPTVRRALPKRLCMAFIALDKHGVTTKGGRGNSTRRTLAAFV
jgi:hypothetical protein